MSIPEQHQIQVSAIIVSYNTRDVTLQCLEALGRELCEISSEILVVDNASRDGSVQAIRDRFPMAYVISNSSNLGFGAANNQAMRCARGEQYLLLNSDTFLLPGSVKAMIQTLQDYPAAGVVGPSLIYPNGCFQRSCFTFPSPGKAWLECLGLLRLFTRPERKPSPQTDRRIVPWLIGACLLLRREVYERVGGFDEHFFMYGEETDWEYRIRKTGYEIFFEPAAEAMHLAGSSRPAEHESFNPFFYSGQDRYYRKHFGPAGFLSYRLAMIVGCILRLSAWSCAALVSTNVREQVTPKCKFRKNILRWQLSHWL